MPVTRDIESDVDPLRGAHARIYFVLEPVFRNFLLHYADVPGKPRSEVPSASSESKPALCPAGAETAVGTAVRPALPKRHLIGFFHWRRWGLCFGSFRDFLGF